MLCEISLNRITESIKEYPLVAVALPENRFVD